MNKDEPSMKFKITKYDFKRNQKENKPKPTIIKFPRGFPGENVDFFLRIHRHLPDKTCGDSFPFGECAYSPLPDKSPINAANDYVEKLKKDPEFIKLEEQVQANQMKDLKL
jgi:hypothetical protein